MPSKSSHNDIDNGRKSPIWGSTWGPTSAKSSATSATIATTATPAYMATSATSATPAYMATSATPASVISIYARLSITPSFAPEDTTRYISFLDKVKDKHFHFSQIKSLLSEKEIPASIRSLMVPPSSPNKWMITQDGNFLYIPTNASLAYDDVIWLLFIIYHFLRPLQKGVTGCIEGNFTDKKQCAYNIDIERNVLEMTVSGFGKSNMSRWDPNQSDQDFRVLYKKILVIAMDKIGLKGWKLEDTTGSQCLVNPRNMTIYFNNEQVFLLIKKHGLHGVLNMIKSRVEQLSRISG